MLYELEKGPFQADLSWRSRLPSARSTRCCRTPTSPSAASTALLNTPAGQRSTYDSAVAQQRSQASQLLAAQANLRNSQINLDYTTIKAPIDGKITRTAVTEGNVVGPNTGTLATIVSQDPMYVVFPIPSRALLDLRQPLRRPWRLRRGESEDQAAERPHLRRRRQARTTSIPASPRIPTPSPPAPASPTPNARTPRATSSTASSCRCCCKVSPPSKCSASRAPPSSPTSKASYVYTLTPDNKVVRTPVQLGQSTPSTAAITSGNDRRPNGDHRRHPTHPPRHDRGPRPGLARLPQHGAVGVICAQR